MYFYVSYQLWKPIIGFATLAIFKYLYKKKLILISSKTMKI